MYAVLSYQYVLGTPLPHLRGNERSPKIMKKNKGEVRFFMKEENLQGGTVKSSMIFLKALRTKLTHIGQMGLVLSFFLFDLAPF